ncbi:putative damage-specific DNA binding protein [Trypanosoma grayi]|uniref:putative damage-specific DNA binding protein n=1 Tax=Trypanosoma grayi TaxID=71804 RepID=UPI0004F420F7|nr:putative damage-specific DNA binding protein [Trypanosoma grayi]KEG14382.1 putative damage-specific DNA binding protein [Trypanosoma grayi]
MPFAVSTSKSPTAVLGAVTGHFLGNIEGPLVLLNRLNMVSLFKEKGQSFEHIGDFSLFASLKFLEALPFFSSKGAYRHVAFFLSVKQEVSLVAFRSEYNGDGERRVEMVTLFYGDVDTYFHQQRPSEVSLCCSGVYRTPMDETLPIVTFSIHRGGVFVFDAAAAIASYNQGSESFSQSLDALFSSNYTHCVLKRQKQRALFTYVHFTAAEIDVRRIALGHADTEKGLVYLYVLYADSSTRTHLSEYTIDFGNNEEQRRGVKSSSRPWIPDAVEGLPGGSSFRRKMVLLANVETNACVLHVVSDGLFVAGPQLLTFISRKVTATQSASWKNVTTVAFPPFPVYIEPVCCASLPNRELLIAFWDGTYVKAMIMGEIESLNQYKIVFTCCVLSSLRTIPSSIAVVDNFCVLGSRMADTLWMNWISGESGVLVKNCGPVLNITVETDGPRMSVIASTGVGSNGGLSLVRSSVKVQQDTSIDNLSNMKRICVAGEVIIFTFPGYSRVCRATTKEESTMVLEELSGTSFDTSRETLALVFSEGLNAFLQVTAVGLNAVQSNDWKCIMWHEAQEISHAHANSGLLVFSSSASVFVLHVDTLVVGKILQLENEVSSLVVLSSDSFLIGEWSSAAVCLYQVLDCVPHLRSRFVCSATPCSMCVVPYKGETRLLVGLLNGYVVDLAVKDMTIQGFFRETLIMMQPLRLFNLERHNAVLCLGEVPLVIIVSDTGFQLSGIDFNDVTACAIVGNPSTSSRYLFFSRSERALIFGDIIELQKLNMSFLAFNATVTLVRYILWWDVFVLSVRHNEKDQLLLMMSREATNSWGTRGGEQVSLELLENERCVFLEPIVLGGSNELGAGDEPQKDRAILIGTTFAFPDDQLSLSSRFMWCSIEQGKLITEKPQLRQLGSKDIDGALQCCCIVPNYTGRIALGINGCIALYTWNSVDSTFVAEETICAGVIVTRLVPVAQQGLSCIVALDARHSCFFVQVDTIEGSLSIIARDSEPRGAMDGAILQSGASYNMCFGDDLFNLFCVSHDTLGSQKPSGTSSNTAPNRKLLTKAQYHLGDLITAVHQGSFAPCSVVNDVVPIPNTLVPGVCGPQIVFGTSHGAFGTITPVTNETYLLLKALEVAITEVVPSLGGFSHANFREVLCAGQERGFSRNASFETTNPRAADVLSRRRRQYISKCVCSGDLVETFLTLSEETKQQVVSETEIRVVRWCASMNSTLEEFLEHADLDHPPSMRGPLTSDEYAAVFHIHNTFHETGLPTFPFRKEAINAFIQNLQRTH